MMHKYPEVEKLGNLKVSCSVVGARGYAGLECARLLLSHPGVELTKCFATSDFSLANFLGSPKAKAVRCLRDSELMSNLTDVVFLATPAEVSMELAPKILAAGKKVIDLSGAFRLKEHDYKKWYGFEHSETQLLATAQYGLSPFAGPFAGSFAGPFVGPASVVGDAQTLIANPGCFATAILLALIPMLRDGLVKEDGIVIDAKSGTSGAGKKAAENLLFTEVDGECLPYKIGRHQHYPEVIEALEKFSGKKIAAHLTTSLLPVRRGIIAGVYAQLEKGKTIDDVRAAFSASYDGYSLVSHGCASEAPSLLQLKKVVGTGRTHISYEVEGGRLYLFSCIDNLLKGAASQAVENLNRICDFPVDAGLSHLEALV